MIHSEHSVQLNTAGYMRAGYVAACVPVINSNSFTTILWWSWNWKQVIFTEVASILCTKCFKLGLRRIKAVESHMNSVKHNDCQINLRQLLMIHEVNVLLCFIFHVFESGYESTFQHPDIFMQVISGSDKSKPWVALICSSFDWLLSPKMMHRSRLLAGVKNIHQNSTKKDVADENTWRIYK